MRDKNARSKTVRVFLKSMLFTAAAIALILIGYFSAGYFFSEGV